MGRLIKRAVIIGILALAGLYLGDDLSVRYRIPHNRDPFGSVEVQTYYAVLKKDGKTEFIFKDPATETCVQSLFPHLGYRPCWYVNRNRLKRIDV